MPFIRFIVVTVALTLAAVLQMTLSFAWSIGPARPDFLLTTLVCVAVLTDYPSGAAAGLWAGILMATIIGVNYGSFLVSRSLIGALCGWLSQRYFRDEILVPPIVTLAATFVGEGIYFAMAPTHHPLRWLKGVFFEAIYNMILSLPIVFVLRIVGLKPVVLSPFEQKQF